MNIMKHQSFWNYSRWLYGPAGWYFLCWGLSHQLVTNFNQIAYRWRKNLWPPQFSTVDRYPLISQISNPRPELHGFVEMPSHCITSSVQIDFNRVACVGLSFLWNWNRHTDLCLNFSCLGLPKLRRAGNCFFILVLPWLVIHVNSCLISSAQRSRWRGSCSEEGGCLSAVRAVPGALLRAKPRGIV